MTYSDKPLILFLRVTAAIMLLALPAAFFPFAWMDAIHRWLGLGELLDRPMVQYLARSASLIYAAFGTILIYLSMDVRRYHALLRLIGYGKVLFGLLMLGLDETVGMPWLWTAVEGPVILGYGLILLGLLRRLDH